MIIADTSGLLALFNRREPAHVAASAAVGGERDPLVVSPFVMAELDYLLMTRVGRGAARALVEELAGGAYLLPCIDEDDLRVATEVIDRHADLGLGLTDASLVVLADRHATLRLLTLDRRHFGAVTSLGGAPFELLP
jgi:uncharacterized protein